MSYHSDLLLMRRRANAIETAVTAEEVAALLGVEAPRLEELSQHPPYTSFYVPKRSGGQRLIEAPEAELKKTLKKLNLYLGASYYFRRTTAAYGFVQTPENDCCPRTILTNAQKHCHCRYMLNIDLKDFFHQISGAEVEAVLCASPFSFNNEAARLLSRLVTYNDRLTMGSPTPPVLTNFAFEAADHQLLHICKEYGVTFTRYVDDLTFSSVRPIITDFYKRAEDVLHQHRFYINYDKVKWFGKDDEKRITGLIVDKKVTVPHDFMEHTQQDIQRLKNILEVQGSYGSPAGPGWVQDFEQQLGGKVAFISQIYGPGSETTNYYYTLLQEAYRVDDYLESRSWLDFNYGWY